MSVKASTPKKLHYTHVVFESRISQPCCIICSHTSNIHSVPIGNRSQRQEFRTVSVSLNSQAGHTQVSPPFGAAASGLGRDLINFPKLPSPFPAGRAAKSKADLHLRGKIVAKEISISCENILHFPNIESLTLNQLVC